MTDQTQALLPVTPEDKGLVPFIWAMVEDGEIERAEQAAARHRISHSLPGDWDALEARARSLATEFMRENGISAHWDTAEIYHTFALWLLRCVSAPAALTPSPCPGDAGEGE